MIELKRDDDEHPIPEALRGLFAEIAEAFVGGDYGLRQRPILGVTPIDAATEEAIGTNVMAYGDILSPLDMRTWDRSCYRWMDGYWQVLVDLTTASEPVSDLTLHATVRLEPLRVDVLSVHVP